jgi:hypothetical protein
VAKFFIPSPSTPKALVHGPRQFASCWGRQNKSPRPEGGRPPPPGGVRARLDEAEPPARDRQIHYPAAIKHWPSAYVHCRMRSATRLRATPKPFASSMGPCELPFRQHLR